MNRTLVNAALFRGIDPDVVHRLTSRLAAADFRPGEVIFARGDLGAALYILVEAR